MHNQARLLLENKGRLTSPSHGSLHVVRPGERKYLSLPLGLRVDIGGREVSIYLKEPSFIDPTTQDDMTYGLSMGLSVGDDYMLIDSVAIGKDEIKMIGGMVLNSPNDIQRVSKILTKADKALSPSA